MKNDSTRRDFLCLTGATALAAAASPVLAQSEAQRRPNILWIVSEDNGPNLGCFGDKYADTPNLDTLAARGTRYNRVWSSAPVCAPARTAIITGVLPTATGSEHMRSQTRLPSNMLMFPCYLRQAGYYCTNNAKEDYNLEKTGQVWDESSRQAHWRNRKPGQPFFAVFNFETTHESQIRARPHTPVHDPAKVRLPAFHPDTPEVRLDWAQYHDKMTEMDRQAGQLLRQLDEDGLTEDTIVFYYGDNGPGMPRFKRWPYNSGLHVPLIVVIPDKFRALAGDDYRPGSESARLLSFLDLAPTVLSLAGIRPPEFMHGRPFHGVHRAEPHDYIHGFRGRMDERYDLVRSVRDERFVYVRNFRPEVIYGQFLAYMFQTPTTRIWKQLYDEGKLKAPMTYFWETKPVEELYDLENDPDEVRNLAALPQYRTVLERFRKVQREHLVRIRDLGFLPEDEIHARTKGDSPYEMGHDDGRYPIEKVLDIADLATSGKGAENALSAVAIQAEDSAVRWWAVRGLALRGSKAVRQAGDAIRRAMADPCPSVRVVAAHAMAEYEDGADREKALEVLVGLADVKTNGLYVALAALNAIEALGPKGASVRERVKGLPGRDPRLPERLNGYIPRLLEAIAASS
jgi:uncharacterized sulfatase